MSGHVEFELVSPEKVLVARPVDMVVIPGSEGYLGVLAGHIPLMTAIQPGLLDIHENGVITERIFVTGGFAEVHKRGCTVLVDQAENLTGIDPAAANQTVKDLEEDLEDAKTPEERAEIEKKLGVARARVAALQVAVVLGGNVVPASREHH